MPRLHRSLTLTLFVALALFTVACDKKDDDAGDEGPSKEERMADARAGLEAELPALNALGAKQTPPIVFEIQELEDGKIVAPVPVDWGTHTVFDGAAVFPADETNSSDQSMFYPFTTCNGACEKGRDWAAVVADKGFSNMGIDAPYAKDEKIGESGRFVEVEADGETRGMVAMWDMDEGRHYVACAYHLRPESASWAPVLEAACKAVQPVLWK